jgi:hypothetical protein
MKTDITGTHVQGALRIEPSKSQNNSLAFLDNDNHWIHIDIDTINSLYRTANTNAAKPATVTVKPGPTMSSSPFDEHFKL